MWNMPLIFKQYRVESLYVEHPYVENLFTLKLFETTTLSLVKLKPPQTYVPSVEQFIHTDGPLNIPYVGVYSYRRSLEHSLRRSLFIPTAPWTFLTSEFIHTDGPLNIKSLPHKCLRHTTQETLLQNKNLLKKRKSDVMFETLFTYCST